VAFRPVVTVARPCDDDRRTLEERLPARERSGRCARLRSRRRRSARRECSDRSREPVQRHVPPATAARPSHSIQHPYLRIARDTPCARQEILRIVRDTSARPSAPAGRQVAGSPKDRGVRDVSNRPDKSIDQDTTPFRALGGQALPTRGDRTRTAFQFRNSTTTRFLRHDAACSALQVSGAPPMIVHGSR
jgi:hypothetical protein